MVIRERSGSCEPDSRRDEYRAQYHRQGIRIGNEQASQCKGKPQHPLSQRACRQHLIGQQCCRLGHASATARGTKLALLAAERHELLGAAALAACGDPGCASAPPTYHPKLPARPTSATRIQPGSTVTIPSGRRQFARLSRRPFVPDATLEQRPLSDSSPEPGRLQAAVLAASLRRFTKSHTAEMTTEPSPTEEATRFTEPARTSPTA